MTAISVSAARQSLPEQLDRVEAGEEIYITRHGRVVAVMVRPDALAARRAPHAWAQADRLKSALEAARETPVQPAEIPEARVDELVRAAREARDRG